MQIQNFAEMVKDRVAEQLGDECHVSIHKVNKNNGVTYTGLRIQKEGANLSPIVYLDSQYQNFLPMYVLSNRYRIDGAACILYPTLPARICNRLESSFYIIPSSVHELLILPSDNTEDSDKTREMIKEINDTQVSAEEILSYSLYFYEREENRLYIV